MAYEITNQHHNIVINLTTDSTNTNNLYLQTYVNGSNTPHNPTYPLINGKFTVNSRDYLIGDEITKFEIVQSGNTKLWQTHEGVKVLVNGEEIETTINNQGEFDLAFNEEGKYDIQAVYLGNNSNQMSSTPKQTFLVKQPSLDETGSDDNSGKYLLRFRDATTPDMEYMDGTEIWFRLTKGGKPISGRTIQRVFAGSGVGTSLTNKQGLVKIDNTSFKVGTWKIGAYFYDDEENKVITSTYRTVTVKKGTPFWNDNYETDNATEWVKGATYNAQLRYRGKGIGRTKVQLFVNGTKVSKTTSTNGYITYKFPSKGTFNLKLVFAGDKNYEKVELERKFTIKK